MTARPPAFLLALCAISGAQELFTAPFGPDGTWNLYQLKGAATWNDAKRDAETVKGPGNSAGHLVTFSSIAENHFMRTVANRQSVWCGLTDDERFGAKEAGSHPREGWKWVTGETLSFSNWKQGEPDEGTGRGESGEDAVFIGSYGKWNDDGIGVAGQTATRFPYIVEWETRSKTPVAEATPLTRTWPEESVMPDLVRGKWNARWVSGYVKMGIAGNYRQPRSLQEASPLLSKDVNAPRADGDQPLLVQNQGQAAGNTPWLWLATPDSNRQGWLAGMGGEQANFAGLPPRSNYIGAVVGKIHVKTAGTYTFAISVEDAFALRIGGLKWKSSSGDGYIDPLDPLTVTQPYGAYNTKALAVIDLPAGDHLVEALWMVETSGSELHVLSAPGTHLTEGSTTDWRPLGHTLVEEPVASLGISEAGWTVDCSPPTVRQKGEAQMGLQDGLIKLELDLARISKNGLAAINFCDSPESNLTHYPGASLFPNDRPGLPDDHWPLRAHARLVVPKTGSYQIGLHAAGLAALRIKGGQLYNVSQTAQGRNGLNQRQDSFDFNGQAEATGEPKIITDWMLEKGEYDIDLFYVKSDGPASLAVFACSAGPFPPGLLTTGGAKPVTDVPGLPHSSR